MFSRSCENTLSVVEFFSARNKQKRTNKALCEETRHCVQAANMKRTISGITVYGKIPATLPATYDTRHPSGAYYSLIFVGKFTILFFFAAFFQIPENGGAYYSVFAYRSMFAYHSTTAYCSNVPKT